MAANNKLTEGFIVRPAIILIISMLAIAGCKQQAEEAAATDQPTATAKPDKQPAKHKPTATADTESKPATEASEDTSESETPSQLESMTMDGSSVAAFEKGLQSFTEVASAEEVRKLQASIDYLLVYDLSARGNKEKLYTMLDGLTPKQIVDAAYGQRYPGGR